MGYLYEVLRPISGEPYQPGDIVDGQGWRTLPLLIRQRYIAPRYEAAPVEPAAEIEVIETNEAAPARRGRRGGNAES